MGNNLIKIKVYSGDHKVIHEMLVSSNTPNHAIEDMKRGLLNKYPGSVVKMQKISLDNLTYEDKVTLQNDYPEILDN